MRSVSAEARSNLDILIHTHVIGSSAFSGGSRDQSYRNGCRQVPPDKVKSGKGRIVSAGIARSLQVLELLALSKHECLESVVDRLNVIQAFTARSMLATY